MKRFVQLFAAGVAFLLIGTSALLAQEATFSPGPAVAPGNGANGGFAWGDVNGDGNLDVFIPSVTITINNLTTFAPAASTMTANLPINTNDVGALLADFNGDGVLDLFTTNGGAPASGLYYNTAGVFTLATGTGDLATAGVTGEVFQGLAASPIDHSNYLSVAWPGTFANIAGSTGPYPGGGGIWFLKGGASGFTDIGKGATAGNLGIDTSLSFESWDVRFFDANNDGWQDLLMPGFRNGFSRIDTGSSGARKGTVLFLNDGTGKFIVPTGATLGRTIYALDSIKLGKGGTVDSVVYASAHADTGIIVDDTVRHFAAIGEQWGDLNNDGIEDLILNGLNATDNRDGNGTYVADVFLYGKGDGTFTYKWNGVNVVANNGFVQATNQRAISIGDYNNDGLPDIYTSGNNAAQHLYKNNGNGTYTDNASLDGITAGGLRAGQFVDYNNDGFLDVYLFTGGTSILYKNNINANRWIGFTPVGSGHNKSALGAKFTVYTATQLAGVTKQIRVIKAEGGSAGMGGELRANFGLGAATTFDSVVVNWPDGTRQSWTGAQLGAGAGSGITLTNRYWTIVEGSDVPAAPVRIRPSFVASIDTSLSNTDTLSWNTAAAGAVGAKTYEAQVGANLAFSTIVKDVPNLSATSTIVRLGYSTKFYWRVREFQSGFTGPWSAVDSFHTKYLVDNIVPIKRAPTTNQLGLPLKPTLRVSYVAEASTYHLQVDTVNRFTTNLVLNDSTTALDTFYTFGANLKPNTKYYWRVRGWNAAGSSAFSPVDSFTIMFVPATPVLAFPPDNAPNISINPILKWRRVIPAGQTTPGDSNYVVNYWTFNLVGTKLLTAVTTSHDSSLAVIGLQTRARYYWQVMTTNQGGSSAFTAVDSFTTATEVPVAPGTVSPKGATGVNRVVVYIWSPVPNTTSYHLQVSSTSDFSAIVYDAKVVDTSTVATDTLDASTRYYWHISAVNAGGEGAFSGTATFVTGTKVNVPAVIAGEMPKDFALKQNYPNPFNPSTTISYDIPKPAMVNVTIYDVLGRAVATLANGVQSANHYSVQWNASGVSSGMYFLRIQARSTDGDGEFNAVKKLMLMK